MSGVLVKALNNGQVGDESFVQLSFFWGRDVWGNYVCRQGENTLSEVVHSWECLLSEVPLYIYTVGIYRSV